MGAVSDEQEIVEPEPEQTDNSVRPEDGIQTFTPDQLVDPDGGPAVEDGD